MGCFVLIYTVNVWGSCSEHRVTISTQPIAVWLSLAALIALMGISCFLGWILGRSSTDQKTGLPASLFSNPGIPSYQFPLDG
ncbi:MAG: hypothetical protein HC866_15890 [Leptolyngbyaceae cyanobacterium RU_5_1]|nr:hypothetical protein [Leptolyngbyaceae cyanobacterium RU_5_1]